MLTKYELSDRLDEYAILLRGGSASDFDFAVRFFHATCVTQEAIEDNELVRRNIDTRAYYDHLSKVTAPQVDLAQR